MLDYNIHNIDIEELTDYEINTWNKVLINLYATMDDFERNIEAWESIQKHIRNNILDEMKLLPVEIRNSYESYMKSMYIRMIFPEADP